MELQHINFKIYSSTPETISFENTVHIFHRWIQDKTLEGILIDVADYSHVPSGPGILLIGHDAFYSLELGHENRMGFLYNRRTIQEGDNQSRIESALRSALKAAFLLAKDESWENKVQFASKEIRFFINDRMIVPNKESSFLAIRDELQSSIDNIFGTEKKAYLSYEQEDSRSRFGIQILLPSPLKLEEYVL